jgi:hypothetical protein
MPMTEKQFKEYLMLYGTVVTNWPDEVLADAMRAQHHPALNELIVKEHYYDEELRNNRRFEHANSNLADRIIHAARTTAGSPDISGIAWLQELLTFVLPKPAFALAGVLTLGIVMGFSIPASVPASGDHNLLQTYFESDGELL